jgi:hypothetical protein
MTNLRAVSCWLRPSIMLGWGLAELSFDISNKSLFVRGDVGAEERCSSGWEGTISRHAQTSSSGRARYPAPRNDARDRTTQHLPRRRGLRELLAAAREGRSPWARLRRGLSLPVLHGINQVTCHSGSGNEGTTQEIVGNGPGRFTVEPKPPAPCQANNPLPSPGTSIPPS